MGTVNDELERPRFSVKYAWNRWKHMHLGIILGSIVLLGAIVVTTLYSLSQKNLFKFDGALDMFYLFYNAMNILIIATHIAAFTTTRKVPFKGVPHDGAHEISLLVSLFALVLLAIFRIYPAFVFLAEYHALGKVAKWECASSVLTFVAAVVQVLFLTDASRRRHRPGTQYQGFLGPMFIAFAIYCNLAMWVLVSISEGLREAQEGDMTEMASDFYGKLTWGIVFYTCLPVAGYFRFISCVILSDLVDLLFPTES